MSRTKQSSDRDGLGHRSVNVRLYEDDLGPPSYSAGRPRSTRLLEQSKHPSSFDYPDYLRGAAVVSMVKSTDLWYSNDPVRLVRLNGSRFG